MSIFPLFPIMNSQVFNGIPWEIIGRHEAQALTNHAQTLHKLAERGGLCPSEAVAVIEGKRYYERWPYTFSKELPEFELLRIVVAELSKQMSR